MLLSNSKLKFFDSFALMEMITQQLLEKAQADGVQKLVVGAFVIRDGKYLILKRSETEVFLPKLDEIPSGEVEKGETLAQALIREVKEETGLDIQEICNYVNYFDYLSASGKKARQFNFNVIANPTQKIVLNPSEHSSFCWCNPQDESFRLLNLSKETRSCILEALEQLLFVIPGLAGNPAKIADSGLRE